MNTSVIPKKVFIITTGCQMNEYDSELIRSILAKAGFTLIEDELAADIIMLNTCAIRENAHRKVYGRIHEIRHQRRSAAGGRFSPAGENLPLIGILGCMAANLRKDLLEDRNLNIDFVVGPDSYKRLPELIRQLTDELGQKAYDVTLSEFETYADVFPHRKKGVNAWIAVMRGCNNFCSFCVVPYTRGRERSRLVDNIVAEVRQLAAEGFKQVTLLGQNVNSYFADGSDFADLLTAVSQVEGIERIRFTSPHPKDFPERLLQVVAENPKVCKHIHLPLQAGNNRILEMMNRTYTQEEFIDLVHKMRTLIPHLTLTTDIIVGFPTETDAEFADTLKVMETIEFDAAFIFKYSERKGTIAQRQYPDDVPEAKKTERIVQIQEMQKQISLMKNQAQIGEVQEILIEGEKTAESPQTCQGRNDGNKLVICANSQVQTGKIVQVKITAASPHALKGEILSSF